MNLYILFPIYFSPASCESLSRKWRVEPRAHHSTQIPTAMIVQAIVLDLDEDAKITNISTPIALESGMDGLAASHAIYEELEEKKNSVFFVSTFNASTYQW